MNKVSTVFILIVITAFAYVFGFYTTNGSGTIATSPFPIEVIVNTLNETEHIGYIKTIGITPEGETLFSYRWEDYGYFNVFSVMDEEKEIKEKLDITEIKR